MQHKRFLSECREKDPDVIFIGDCVLETLQHTQTWNQYFAPLHSLNFSIYSDQTQNTLWRIQNGVLDNVKPKVREIYLSICFMLCLCMFFGYIFVIRAKWQFFFDLSKSIIDHRTPCWNKQCHEQCGRNCRRDLWNCEGHPRETGGRLYCYTGK